MGSTNLITDASTQSYGKLIGLDTKHSTPPVNAYVSVDDQLLIFMSATQANIAVTVNARLLLPDGTIVPNTWNFNTNAFRSGVSFAAALPECFILSMVVTANVNSGGRSVYVTVTLARPPIGNSVQNQVLMQGYASLQIPLSWPNGVNQTNLDCVGNIRSITGSTPAAGANISETVPNNARWLLRAFTFSITNSATVANRVPLLQFTDGTNVFAVCGANSALTANQTILASYTWGVPNQLPNATVLVTALSEFLFLSAGFKIQTAVANLQAGDQLTAPQYLVEEWLCP